RSSPQSSGYSRRMLSPSSNSCSPGLRSSAGGTRHVRRRGRGRCGAVGVSEAESSIAQAREGKSKWPQRGRPALVCTVKGVARCEPIPQHRATRKGSETAAEPMGVRGGKPAHGKVKSAETAQKGTAGGDVRLETRGRL